MELFYNSYGQLSDKSSDLYILTQIDGIIIDLNSASFEKLPIEDDWRDKKILFQGCFIDEIDWDNYVKRMNEKGSVSGLDISLHSRDNKIISGLINSCLTTDSQGHVMRAFIIHDITSFMETALNAVKLNLELLDKNRELNNAYNAISHQEKLASLGELSAGVAHEINNPLAFVGSNIKSLERYIQKIFEYDIKVNPEEKAELDFIREDLDALFIETKDGINRIDNITKSLKRFSRMDEESKSSSYNINHAISDTVLIAKNQCPANVEVILQLGDIAEIECYANDINQVMLNIVINGLQAQSEMDEDHKGFLKISTRNNNSFIEIVFEDNGPGIKKEIEQKIYDPFFTTKELGKGTGLGLGICFNIINVKHKGSIWLDSRKDPTRFIINLPIKFGGV